MIVESPMVSALAPLGIYIMLYKRAKVLRMRGYSWMALSTKVRNEISVPEPVINLVHGKNAKRSAIRL